MADIKLDGITKRYDDGFEAVKHLDLEVADGEFLILVGPSGCGKSTALRMVAGLEDITEGQLLIDGQVVNDRAPKDRDIAMVFQSYALYPHMTVGENMAFPLKLAKLPQAEIDKRVADTAKILDLLALLPPGQQEVIRLKFQNGFSYQEISRISGHSVGNVGYLIHVGLKTLRGRLADLSTAGTPIQA